MLPLALLRGGQGHPVLVELKSGETYNGHLVQCDSWMNMHLKEVRDRGPSLSVRGWSDGWSDCTRAPPADVPGRPASALAGSLARWLHASRSSHSCLFVNDNAGHMYVEGCGQVYTDARSVHPGQHSQVPASAG
mmetsp:Transcript_921/g.2699  ORF Transcript_921/g.2699 Transcript_921/m.2699 type:complete len:134 (+) Transcript_921:253-654(+)